MAERASKKAAEKAEELEVEDQQDEVIDPPEIDPSTE